jgi:hypothetical protein
MSFLKNTFTPQKQMVERKEWENVWVIDDFEQDWSPK